MLEQLEAVVRRIGQTVVTAAELSVTEKEGHANFVTAGIIAPVVDWACMFLKSFMASGVGLKKVNCMK